MKKRNTRIAATVSGVCVVISSLLTVISWFADFFTFEDGVIERKKSFLSVLINILVFLGVHWKWVMLVTAVLLAVFIYFRLQEKKRIKERLARDFSWFAPEQRNTNFSGGAEYLNKLKCFFGQKNVDFSWWVVTGVAGMGKTRLVIEALRDEEFVNSDAQWIKEFDDYREDSLKKRVDGILKSRNYRNIILAEDAQIYMDNIGTLINYIMGKTIDEMGDHKIRLLLLIRKGEDGDLEDRYKQLESKPYQSKIQNTRFKEFGKELTIEKYTNNDIDEVVKSYAINTKRNLSEKKLTNEQIAYLQDKTKDTLKSEKVDPDHLRPLFAMFITDALLAGKEPMFWNREKVLEYAVVDREDKFMSFQAADLQLRDNRFVFDKIRGIICLAIIRNGLNISELEGIREELEDELRLSRITLNDFLLEMQLLDNDGKIRSHMPDILSEYYVLRNMVIKHDDRVLPWCIGRLCISLEGVQACRKKIRQDFKYLYPEIENELSDFYNKYFDKCNSSVALEIIRKLFSEFDLRDTNTFVLHGAIGNLIRNSSFAIEASDELSYMIFDIPEIEEKSVCMSEMKRIFEANKDNRYVTMVYCKNLSNMITFTPIPEEREEYFSELKRYAKDNDYLIDIYCNGVLCMLNATHDYKEKEKYLSELESVYNNNTGVEEIVEAYSKGLANMVGDAPETKKKRKHLQGLKQLLKDNDGNINLIIAYSMGLFNMINGSSDTIEKQQCLEILMCFAQQNSTIYAIVYEYLKGLVNMIIVDPSIKNKRRYLSELERLSRDNKGNADFVLQYCMGLHNMINSSHDLGEKRKCLQKLQSIAEKNANDFCIVLEYVKGVFDIRYDDTERYEYYISVLNAFLSIESFNQFVAIHEPIIVSQLGAY